ncbi:MAG: DMT family transporter [Fusobacteriaceae bacterium]
MLKAFKNNSSAYWLLSFTACTWGISFPVSAVLLKEMSPYQFVAIRYLVSGIILALICFKRLKNIGSAELKGMMWIGIPTALGIILQMVGLEKSSPSNTGLIAGMTITIIPIIEFFADKKRTGVKTILGIAVAFAGLFIMSATKNYTIGIGELIVFSSTICFAVQIYFLGKVSPNVDPILLTILQLFMMGIFALPFTLFMKMPAIIFSAKFLWYMVFLIFVPGIFAMIMQNKIQPKIPTLHATLIYLLEPVAAIGAACAFGEDITAKQIFGSIIIIAGILVVIFTSGERVEKVIISENI